MTRRRPLPLFAVSFVILALWPLLPAPLPSAGAAGGEPSPTGSLPSEVLPAGARLSERIVGLPGLSNVGRVAPGLVRGAQPEGEGYATLRAMGIRTVINLRTRHGEKEAVEGAGMRSIEIPLRVAGEVDVDAVRRAVRSMRDPANRPVFVHCALGKDRTGVVVAVYRMEAEGWTVGEATAEMRSFGFNEVWRNLRGFVERYPARGGADAVRKGEAR